jgi:superkiller protein 3
MEKAMRFFDKKEYTKAEKEFKDILHDEPFNSKAHYYLAQILVSKNKLLAAQKQLEEATVFDASFKEAWNLLGIVSSDLDQPQTALVAFSRALQIDPNFIEAYFNLGLLSLKMPDKQDEAKAYFEEVLKRDGRFPGVHHHLGVIYQEKNKIGEAIHEYKKEIEITGNPDTYFNLGLIYLERKKDYELAKAQFVAVLKLRPKDDQAQAKLEEADKELRGE